MTSENVVFDTLRQAFTYQPIKKRKPKKKQLKKPITKKRDWGQRRPVQCTLS